MIEFERHSIHTILRSALLAGLALATAQAHAGSDPAAWAPADAIAFVGIADFDLLTESVRKTSAGRLADDPGAAHGGVAGAAADLPRQLRQRVAKALDCKPEDVRNPLGGAVAVVLVRDGESPGQVVISAGVRDAGLAREYLAKASTNFAKLAGRHESIAAGGTTIEWFAAAGESKASHEADGGFDASSPADDLTGFVGRALGGLLSSDEMPVQFAVCLTNDRLIVSGSREAVAAALRMERGASLAGSAEYADAMKAFATVGPARVFVDVPRIFDWMKSVNPRGAEETIAILGGECLRSLAGQMVLGGEKFESKTDVDVRMTGRRSGLAKIFSAPNKPLQALGGDDCAFLASWNADPSGIVDELGAVLRRIAPELAERMRQELQAVSLGESATLNVRRDVIAHAKGPLAFSLGIPPSLGAESISAMFSAEHDDHTALIHAMEPVQKALSLTREDSGEGSTFFMPGLRLWLTIGEHRLGIGNLTGSSSAPPTLAVAAGPIFTVAFKRASESAPAEASGFVYCSGPRLAAAAIEFAQRAPTSPVAIVAADFARVIIGDVDRNRLDEARRLAAFETNRLLTLTTTPEGVRFTYITLLPEGSGAAH